MAEFGENLRKAREEMGITQQTLADQLYVTRQAVSRWENGSRYPDLLTAKKLAAALDTSLDELLTNDDMRTFPEVNPVIEYPLHKRVQTALFAAAVVTNLIMVIWYIGFILTANDRAFMTDWDKISQLAGTISSALITGILIYGLFTCLRQVYTMNTTAADKHYAVLLKVVTFTGNIRGYFNTVRKTNTGNLTKCRVRLLRGSSAYLGANTTLLR